MVLETVVYYIGFFIGLIIGGALGYFLISLYNAYSDASYMRYMMGWNDLTVFQTWLKMRRKEKKND